MREKMHRSFARIRDYATALVNRFIFRVKGVILSIFLWAALSYESIEESCETCHTEQAVLIRYRRFGRNYLLHVPYSERDVRRMTSHQVFLEADNGDTTPITQQPGIPYMVSAKELGGKSIVAMNGESGKRVIYEKGKRPGFLEELKD